MSRKSGVCLIFLWITAAEASFMISSGKFTWQEASTTDNFATPSIEVNYSSLSVNITIDVTNKEAWVGYYLRETAFAYIGCWRFKDAKANVILPIEQNSPGFCYSMCDKSHRNYIGLRSDMCFCMSERQGEAINYPECDISPDGTWLAGGGNEYISIYERIKTDIDASSANNGKCLDFERKRRSWWSICSQSYLVLCKKGADIFTVYKNGKNFFKWSHYVNNCFENNSFPITYNDTVDTSIELAVGQSWTNVIRSDVIYKYNETSNSIGRGYLVKYGYITNTGTSVYLNFTENSSDKKWYLLQTYKGTVTKDPTSSPTVTSTSSKDSVSYTSSTFSMNDGSVNSTDDFQSISKTNTSKSSDVSVPVSISAVAITLLVIIVVIITLKRRGKIQTKCCRKVQSDSSDYTTPDTHLAVQSDYTSLSPHYDQISVVELPSTSYTDYNAIHDKNEHLYSDLEKHGGGSYINTNIASHDNKY